MSEAHYVIVGNGAAGNAAADVLREGDADAQITIISDEPFPFYFRHKLPSYIVGKAEEDDLTVGSPAHYRDRNIGLRLGQTVQKVDFDSKTIYLTHMEKVSYTKLLLCCGSKPRIPERYACCREHLTMMNKLSHARQLRSKLEGVRRVVMVGGDLVSLQVTHALIESGREVVFMVDRDSFWPLELNAERRAELIAHIDELPGVQVLPDNELVDIKPTDDGYNAITKSGASIACDMIGAFFGLTPDVDFLLGSGLDIERGILVNDHLHAGPEGVYAAGDCAEVYHPELRNYWVSIGWPNARRLGQVAAANALGEGAEAHQPPTSALDVEGVTVNTTWWRNLDSRR